MKARITAALILVASLALGFFVYTTQSKDSPYALQYGLDLSGGTHLVYEADVSKLAPEQIDPALASLRDVIERRVNAFGVSEPLVQVEETGLSGETKHRLIVELPGIEDASEAKRQIGETPLLEFKLQRSGGASQPFGTSSEASGTSTATSSASENQYESTDLTGRYLSGARLEFGSGQQGGVSNEPVVLLDFNEKGSQLFAEITGNNVGEVLAIFLDGRPISTPVIQQQITGGTAQITGDFSAEEARKLVRDLNLGALPVPIELVTTQTVGAQLGQEVKNKGITAGIVGLVLVSLYLIFWYRLPGLISVMSLGIYILIMLALFKLIPVTLTAAGIAGFILSIGMAVDANVLIFERIKEELNNPRDTMREVIREGFSRAWPSIRDANISSLISAVILYMVGTTLTQGFAVTFGVGVLVSMVTAITISRTFLLAVAGKKRTKTKHTLFAPGLRSGNEFNEHTD